MSELELGPDEVVVRLLDIKKLLLERAATYNGQANEERDKMAGNSVLIAAFERIGRILGGLVDEVDELPQWTFGGEELGSQLDKLETTEETETEPEPVTEPVSTTEPKAASTKVKGKN